jgi:hypothetical protein
VDLNGRTTNSKSGVPLTHALIRLTGARPSAQDIHANAIRVWARMKEEVVAEIRRLYESAEPDQYLAIQRAAVTNANLDVNKP